MSYVMPYMWMKSVKILLNYCVQETEITTMTQHVYCIQAICIMYFIHIFVGKIIVNQNWLTSKVSEHHFEMEWLFFFLKCLRLNSPLISYHSSRVRALFSSICHFQSVARAYGYFRNWLTVELCCLVTWCNNSVTLYSFGYPSSVPFEIVCWKCHKKKTRERERQGNKNTKNSLKQYREKRFSGKRILICGCCSRELNENVNKYSCGSSAIMVHAAERIDGTTAMCVCVCVCVRIEEAEKTK